MTDFLTALGLAVMLEGMLYALFPAGMQRMMSAVLELPPARLRLIGLGGAVLGLVGVWLARLP